MQKPIGLPRGTEQLGVAEEAVGALHRSLGTTTIITSDNITQPTATTKLLLGRSDQLQSNRKLKRRKLVELLTIESHITMRLRSKTRASAEDVEATRVDQVKVSDK